MQNNLTIATRAYLNGTSDFQQRIPNPTQSSLSQFADALFDPMNRQYLNQFTDYLVNVPAKTIAQGKVFKNNYEKFKGEMVPFGFSIQNFAFEWLQAHPYRDDVEDLWKLHRPKGQSWWVSQNRRDKYKVSTVEQELYAAFNNEFGLNQYLQKVIQLPVNSDNYDEQQIMVNLLALYHNYWKFQTKSIVDVSDKNTGEDFLVQVMADTDMIQLQPSTTYNAVNLHNIPTWENIEDMILIITPQTNSILKVKTYAGLFNKDEAEVQAQIVKVPFIPVPGAVAILTSKHIFDVHDTYYSAQSIYDPNTLATHHFLHHWGIYGINPFVPAILYSTTDNSEIPEVTQTVSGFQLTAETETASAGDIVQLIPELQGSLNPSNPDNLKVSPQSCTWSVTLNEGVEAGISSTSALNVHTYVDEYARLHIQRNNLSSGDKITVKARSTYWNPTTQEINNNLVASVDITIS